MKPDYGPIPMSRLRWEASGIFNALGQGRRVLLSSQGKVVAAIGPVTPVQVYETLDQIRAHEKLLAEFERAHPEATPEEFAQAGELAGERVLGPDEMDDDDE